MAILPNTMFNSNMGYIETSYSLLRMRSKHLFNSNMGYIETLTVHVVSSTSESLIVIWDILKRYL